MKLENVSAGITTYLKLVDGGSVLACLIPNVLGLNLISVIIQALANWSLGIQILVGGSNLTVLLNISFNLQTQE